MILALFPARVTFAPQPRRIPLRQPLAIMLLASLVSIGRTEPPAPSTSVEKKERTPARVLIESPASDQEQREKLLENMRRRAGGITVVVLADQEKLIAELVAEPLLRFSDQPRGLRDATVWCWCHQGRPVALLKTQVLGDEQWVWLDGLHSLANDLIEAEWVDGHHFSSRKPGLEWMTVADAPGPDEKLRVRLRQMRDMARRCSITIWPGEGGRQEMRLLTQALYRYSAPHEGVVDGALFGFTTNGTNPDAVLAIEVIQGDGPARTWRYGLAQITSGRLSARWDDREVWSASQKAEPTAYDEWIWFRASPEVEHNQAIKID